MSTQQEKSLFTKITNHAQIILLIFITIGFVGVWREIHKTRKEIRKTRKEIRKKITPPPLQKTTPLQEKAISKKFKAFSNIQKQVLFLRGGVPSMPNEYKYAVLTMNYMQSHLSPFTHAYMSREDILPKTLDELLLVEAGICGNHVEGFVHFLKKFNIKARSVKFLQIDKMNGKTHTGAEVWFENKWNYFDITWGTYFRKPGGKIFELLSINEILQQQKQDLIPVTNNTNLCYIINKKLYNPFDYLSSSTMNLILGHTGTITLKATKTEADYLHYSLKKLLNYIGKNNQGEIKYQILGIPPTHSSIILHIDAIVYSKKHKAMLNVRAKNKKITIPLLKLLNKKTYKIDITSLPKNVPLIIEILYPKNKVCYLVLKSIVTQ